LSYISLTVLIVVSIGLIINYIIFNRKPKRTDYSDFYAGLAERQIKRLEEQRPETRPCDTLEEITFWEVLNPLIERSQGNFFNFISLVKDRLIRKDPEYIVQFDNTFLKLIEPHYSSLNYSLSKRLFPEDEWHFLTYMSFLISKGEQRFKWLATYPTDVFKSSFEINAELSISGVCGHCYYYRTTSFIPGQKCFLQEEPMLWNDKLFQQNQVEIYNYLQQIVMPN
jgi:hypothetical protein